MGGRGTLSAHHFHLAQMSQTLQTSEQTPYADGRMSAIILIKFN